eukprot:2466902-Pyramimonas_sp.AAC.1
MFSLTRSLRRVLLRVLAARGRGVYAGRSYARDRRHRLHLLRHSGGGPPPIEWQPRGGRRPPPCGGGASGGICGVDPLPQAGCKPIRQEYAGYAELLPLCRLKPA